MNGGSMRSGEAGKEAVYINNVGLKKKRLKHKQNEITSNTVNWKRWKKEYIGEIPGIR